MEGDIGDRALVRSLLDNEQPKWVVNFAAESHVDRSIDGPGAFVMTNVVGTFHLLDEGLHWWRESPADRQADFRFLHVSTDEVYGSLGPTGLFREDTPYSPNSRYSASKASSDHFVQAYHHTYGLPVYGDGSNIRDWLFVDDHCRALKVVLEQGALGEVYNVGGSSERTNLQVVHAICDTVDSLTDPLPSGSRRNLITFVKDRPGHDQRYAIDCSKLQALTGWAPAESFESGLRRTIAWYLENSVWIEEAMGASYRGERLGVG